MTDTVFIQELTAYATIGAYDWEQTIKQKLLFNLALGWDFSQAAASDDVQYCLDYAKVAERVVAFVEGKPFKLVETVAYQVADILQSEFGIVKFRLELHKPQAVANAKSVGVIIERGI